MKLLKISLLVLLVLLAASVLAAQRSGRKYTPTERIPADTAVAFPVDI